MDNKEINDSIVAGGKSFLYSMLFCSLGLVGMFSSDKSLSYGFLLPVGLFVGIGMFTFGSYKAFYNSKRIISKKFWRVI